MGGNWFGEVAEVGVSLALVGSEGDPGGAMIGSLRLEVLGAWYRASRRSMASSGSLGAMVKETGFLQKRE